MANSPGGKDGQDRMMQAEEKGLQKGETGSWGVQEHWMDQLSTVT